MIDCSVLPEWADWIAQDEDGAWWAYEAHPNQHDTGWYENEVGRIQKLGRTAPNADWQNSLRRVVRTGQETTLTKP